MEEEIRQQGELCNENIIFKDAKSLAIKYNLSTTTIRTYYLLGYIRRKKECRKWFYNEQDLKKIIIEKIKQGTCFAGSLGFERALTWDYREYLRVVNSGQTIGRIYTPVSWIADSQYTLVANQIRKNFTSLFEAKAWIRENL